MTTTRPQARAQHASPCCCSCCAPATCTTTRSEGRGEGGGWLLDFGLRSMFRTATGPQARAQHASPCPAAVAAVPPPVAPPILLPPPLGYIPRPNGQPLNGGRPGGTTLRGRWHPFQMAIPGAAMLEAFGALLLRAKEAHGTWKMLESRQIVPVFAGIPGFPLDLSHHSLPL